MNAIRTLSLSVALVAAMAAPSAAPPASPPAADSTAALRSEADQFLAFVNPIYKALETVDSAAQWDALTDVTPEHDAAAAVAAKAKAAFNGSPALISEAQRLLEHSGELDTLTVRQLRLVMLNAAEGPMTKPELVAARIDAETALSSTLNAFTFKLSGKAITTNDIDEALVKEKKVKKRLAVWEASKQSGPALKPGLVKLQGLRNGVARELGYTDYFALQVTKYDMTTEEMLKLNEHFMDELRPLYVQLHTWAKYELAARYGQPVPERIPAHWLPNRWAQSWEEMLPAPTDPSTFTGKSPKWITQTAEKFYTGIGFGPLPATFWERSDLYPLPADAKRKKNTHASCWHMDPTRTFAVHSIAPNMEWFTPLTTVGLAVRYQLLRPEIPLLVSSGWNLVSRRDGRADRSGAAPDSLSEGVGLSRHRQSRTRCRFSFATRSSPSPSSTSRPA
jgi:peptidyl-dipeptidase A